MMTPLGYPRADSAFTDRAYRNELDKICFAEEYGTRVEW